jgi:4-diphosphocytidyl-2-C-methyl-D-erythritol kinase
MSCDSEELPVAAPAKINIGLSVLPKRDDGYHGIEGIFQAIGLWDTLWFRRDIAHPSNCWVRSGFELPADNTICRAYDAFCALTGNRGGVIVNVKKGIPIGAGLGGGSSDGAAAIRGLNVLFDTRLSPADMDSLAEKVGSDVFFFLRCGDRIGGAAYVSGRGEVVQPLSAPKRGLPLVVVVPPVYSGTEAAFRALDEFRQAGGKENGNPRDPPGWIARYEGDVKSWDFTNDFAESLVSSHPEIGRAMEDLTVQGSVFTSVTGSGSAVYGVFESQGKAKNAVRQLADKWPRCFTVSAI